MTPTASLIIFRSTADRSMFYGVCGALVAAPILPVIYAASIKQFEWGGSIAMLLGSLGFFLLGVMFFVDSSDLVISEDGLSRRIFGRICMQIPWTGIKVIREQFLVNQRYGGEIRIDILPRKLQGTVLAFRRTIKFSEQIDNFDELIELLNSRAEQYAIRIEIASKGIWNLRSKLVTSAPTQVTTRSTF